MDNSEIRAAAINAACIYLRVAQNNPSDTLNGSQADLATTIKQFYDFISTGKLEMSTGVLIGEDDVGEIVPFDPADPSEITAKSS